MKEYRFNPEQARDNLVEEIRRIAREQRFTKVVLGISGGKEIGRAHV